MSIYYRSNNEIYALLLKVQQQGVQIMAAGDDLKAMVANIQADEAALGTAIAAVQAALAGMAAGSVSAADVEAAVANLATAHTAFQANVTALDAIATPVAPTP